MKHFTFFLFFLPVVLQAQTAHDLELLNACKKEVKAINSQTLYKMQFFWDEYKNTNITVVDYNSYESGFLIYYDTEKRIRKCINTFSYPEENGFAIRYFDTDGYLIYSIHYHGSAMAPPITGYRYMNKGKLVYISIEVKGEIDVVTEVVERFGGKIPDSEVYSFDKDFHCYLHTDSIKNTPTYVKLSFNTKTDKQIIFSLPKAGDKTVTNVRRANLRKNPSTTAEITTVIELGSIVQILERTNTDWYKINVNGQNGYIFGELLEPVEQVMK